MNLTDIPLIDQHGHNLLRPQVAADYPYAAAFTQGYDPEIINHHARHTLFYRRSLLEIETLLGETHLIAEIPTRIGFESNQKSVMSLVMTLKRSLLSINPIK